VRPLAPSPAWTLVTPYCKRTRPRRGTNTKAAGFPPLSRPSPATFLPPSRSASRRPIWAGARGDISLVGPGTPPVSKRRQNGKRKRKGISCSLGRGVLAQSSASVAGGLAGPRRSGAARADAVGAGPRISERRGVNGVERQRRGVNRSARPPVMLAAVLRHDPNFATGKWWRGTGGGRGSQGWGQFDRRRPRVAGPRRGGGRSLR
jgi:hypothetical protein